MIRLAVQSLRIFLVLSVIVGILYPLAVTLFGQLFWSYKANGSIIETNHQVVGSELLAQKTESPRLFWPRPSASDFGAVPSGASNQGPTSETLKLAVQERKARGQTAEMLFASGSGLDPHISSNAAFSQLPRIGQARNMNQNEMQALEEVVKAAIERRDLGFLGEERINVFLLNLKLIEKFGK